jgi:hypothetical protein
MFTEQRLAPRESLQLPLTLSDGSPAVTRDISTSGMYLEVDGVMAIDTRLVFEMHLVESNIKFMAEGRVVRVEYHDGSTGIAVKLIAPRLETLG